VAITRALWWQIPGCILLAVLILWRAGAIPPVLRLFGVDTDLVNGIIPKCDSASVLSTAKKAIEEAPTSKLFPISMFEIRNVVEKEYRTEDGTRSCEGIAFTNLGKRQARYSIEWSDRARRTFYVRVELFGEVE
jgi:hypothetical protein